MSDGNDAASALKAVIQGRDYTILDTVLNLPEKDQRRVLRFHRDEPLPLTDDEEETSTGEGGEKSDAGLRYELDRALDGIELFELGQQTGLLDNESAPPTEALTKLFEVRAFDRYLDCYLYFHTRFVAHRLG